MDVLNLSKYAPAFYDAGADNLDLLEGVTVDEFMEDFNMTQDEAEKLKKYVDRGGGGAIEYLEPLNLSEYAGAFDDAGADTLDLLEGMTVDELTEQFKMTRIHANKLRKAVNGVSARWATSVSL